MSSEVTRWCEFSKFRSEEHTSELQSRPHLVCRLLLEKKNNIRLIRAQPLDIHLVFGRHVDRVGRGCVLVFIVPVSAQVLLPVLALFLAGHAVVTLHCL